MKRNVDVPRASHAHLNGLLGDQGSFIYSPYLLDYHDTLEVARTVFMGKIADAYLQLSPDGL